MFSIPSLLMYAFFLIVGFGLGFAWYRNKVKKDPALIERVRDQAMDLKGQAVRQYDNLTKGD